MCGTITAHWQFHTTPESVDKTHNAADTSLTAFLGLLPSRVVSDHVKMGMALRASGVLGCRTFFG